MASPPPGAYANRAQNGRTKRVPIIALTANVMSEDRENCIAAGMDAHLGKPIEPAQLIDCLSRYLKSDQPSEVDMTALRELTGGDVEFERELLQTFVSSGDQCLAEILSALRAGDFDTIGKPRACAQRRQRQYSRLGSERPPLEPGKRGPRESGR